MNPMLTLRGGAALSDFRIAKLLARMHGSGVAGIRAEFRYFVELADPLASVLSEADLVFLGELLHAEPHQPSEEVVLVVPRLGTVSPWSSKATDIVRNCHLDAVRRIERSIVYELKGRRDRAIRVDLALPHLFDRMTESMLYNEREADKLFHHVEPQPLQTVNILKGGRRALEKANAEWGLALSADEIDYLVENFKKAKRNPTEIGRASCRERV